MEARSAADAAARQALDAWLPPTSGLRERIEGHAPPAAAPAPTNLFTAPNTPWPWESWNAPAVAPGPQGQNDRRDEQARVTFDTLSA